MAQKQFYALSIIIDPKGFAYDTGVSFRGLTISEASDDYNVIIRGRLRDGQAVYAMTKSDNPEEALRNLMGVLGSKNGKQLWHKDRFARN